MLARASESFGKDDATSIRLAGAARPLVALLDRSWDVASRTAAATVAAQVARLDNPFKDQLCREGFVKRMCANLCEASSTPELQNLALK